MASQQVEQPRVLLVWLPDWTVRAARTEVGLGPLLVLDRGVVVACCEHSKTKGVRIGLRVREAQLHCPEAHLVEWDARLEEEAFEAVIEAIEAVVPEVHLVRPGAAAVRMRGPARFYGGELAAAQVVQGNLVASGFPEARIGVADGLFTAQLAARQQRPITIISAGRNAEFLEDQPVETLEDQSTARLLRQLGISTLGGFAALPTPQVVSRFGASGRMAQLRARGMDCPRLQPRTRVHSPGAWVNFEEPLWLADQVVERSRLAVAQLFDEVSRSGKVCTEISIMVRTSTGVRQRTWRHPWQFTANDVLSRLGWQLDALAAGADAEDDGVVAVQFIPTSHPAADHAEGLFGDRPSEHLIHVLTQFQQRDGSAAVLMPSLTGDRIMRHRCVLTPFGTAPSVRRDVGGEPPWPGRPVGPAPTVVFPTPLRVGLCDAQGQSVAVSDGQMAAEPVWFTSISGHREAVVAWAGPWPVRQRWWGKDGAAIDRVQLITATQRAWLIAGSGQQWWAEACYD